MSTKAKVFVALALVAALISCGRQPGGRDAQSDNIPVASPSDAGLDSVKLEQMAAAIASQDYPNIHSVLVTRDGKLVFERYFSGQDQVWGDDVGMVNFDSEELHDVRSISKSVVSACIGIAVAQGRIDSVGQSVFDFFPQYAEYKTGPRAVLTVEHLLTMSSGISWNEDVPYDDPENSEILMTQADDPVGYVLSQPMDTLPGTVWEYNGGTTQVLASIIRKVSGEEVDEFARIHLFEPLGIMEFEWTRYPFTRTPAAASGLRLRPRDLLKFGLLYYNGGVYNGRRILEEDWVKSSMAPHVSRGNGESYGYQFWLWPDAFPGASQLLVAGVGNGDQRIYISRDARMVVVFTAGNYNQWNIPRNSMAVMRDFIYPAVF